MRLKTRNSKEFLNKIIVFSKEQINYYENKIAEDENYPSLQQCHQEELISTQEGLNHFLKIKQDLDRLEQLEEENAKLKIEILSLELDICIPDLRKENAKLKQALELIKHYLTIANDVPLMTFAERCFTEEEVKLLKEVLCND